ncbi:3-keto-disaccharide hydrolase [Luteolibacter soli]|uniref:DUF1080 domain-containing protein n=1 Tax=Luteolibacter soli TaxID=3135280 RepID=A0ABU9AX65_9BACT
MKSILLLLAMAIPAFSAPNELSPEEKKDGFKLLFDGKTLKGWRTYKEKEAKEQWKVQDGAIVLTAGGGGDLITDDEYADFDFRCEWKIADQGNSGIIWRSTEDHQYPWMSGPEYQILDSFDKPGHKYAHETKKANVAGGFYDIIPAKPEWSKPVGEWNEARLVIKGTKVTLYLNGNVTADVDTESDDFKAMLDKSKFKGWEFFNKAKKGHIVFQDHGDKVEFRSVRIKQL